MTDKKHKETWARLFALSKVREAQIKANPTPFLNHVAEENYRLRQAIEGAMMHLSGATAFDVAQDILPTLPPSIIETAVARIEKAAEILSGALSAQERDDGR